MDTYSYMVAGYAIIFGILLIYAISLGLRKMSVQRHINKLNHRVKKNHTIR